jgi:hypothetical protein
VSGRAETADRGRGRGAGPAEPEVVVVGAASRDLAPDDPRGWRLGGGVAYAALTCARLGVRTAAVIGLDPQASDAQELGLLAGAGVLLFRVPLAHGPVFRNLESPGGRVQACVDPGSTLPVVAVRHAWRRAGAWILAPVAGELEDAWADSIFADAYVALGWQGLLRGLRAGSDVTRRAPSAGRLVQRADLVSLSEHDVAPGTRPEELARFLHPGARLVVTRGAAGGHVADVTGGGVGNVAPYQAVTAAHQVDATGAGDTFLAALVVSVIRGKQGAEPAPADGIEAARHGWPAPDLRFAAAAASLTVEGPGMEAVPNRAAVMRRLAGPDGQFAEPPSSST